MTKKTPNPDTFHLMQSFRTFSSKKLSDSFSKWLSRGIYNRNSNNKNIKICEHWKPNALALNHGFLKSANN